MAKRKGIKSYEDEPEGMYVMGVGSLHNVSDRPVKTKPKKQIGFIRPKAKNERKPTK